MKIAFLLCGLLYFNTCFSQDSSKILGNWCTCSCIDSLKDIKFQKFIKELSPDSCRKEKCTITIWYFKKDVFGQSCLSACSDDAIGTASTATALSWSYDDSTKRLTIIDETKKNITFDVLSLTDKELIVKIYSPISVDSFYFDPSEINSNKPKEYKIKENND